MIITMLNHIIGTYSTGFQIVIEPVKDLTDQITRETAIQFICLDPSFAMKAITDKHDNIVLTSGTMSPVELYTKILNIRTSHTRSFRMSAARRCVCPIVVHRGDDQQELSTSYESRKDDGLIRNYGLLINDVCKNVPDGVVVFFPSYYYMLEALGKWHSKRILDEICSSKLVFVETKDASETSQALAHYRIACDRGRGAVFFCVARGKVSEGIDFDNHYGRAVVVIGIPYVYTESPVLQERLKYLSQTYHIKDKDYLDFDAIRVAAQCVGRVIRSKSDYGVMIFADKRYSSADILSKFPVWIKDNFRKSHTKMSVDGALSTARVFLKEMAQPIGGTGTPGTLDRTPDAIGGFQIPSIGGTGDEVQISDERPEYAPGQALWTLTDIQRAQREALDCSNRML